MYTPFKMKGKSPMMKALIGKQGNLPAGLKAKILASPAKATSKAAKNLLKAVPNKKAYEKLSDIDKKGFNKAAKEAGLPTKKSPNRMMGKDPSKKKTKMLKGTTIFGKEVNKKNVKRAVNAVATGGMSEVARKAAKTKVGKKVIKGVKKVYNKTVGPVVKGVKEAANSGVLQAGGPRRKKVKAKAVKKGAAEGAISRARSKGNTTAVAQGAGRKVKAKLTKSTTKPKPSNKTTGKRKVKNKGLSDEMAKNHTLRNKLVDKFTPATERDDGTTKTQGRGTLIGNQRARQQRNKKRFLKK